MYARDEASENLPEQLPSPGEGQGTHWITSSSRIKRPHNLFHPLRYGFSGPMSINNARFPVCVGYYDHNFFLKNLFFRSIYSLDRSQENSSCRRLFSDHICKQTYRQRHTCLFFIKTIESFYYRVVLLIYRQLLENRAAVYDDPHAMGDAIISRKNSGYDR